MELQSGYITPEDYQDLFAWTHLNEAMTGEDEDVSLVEPKPKPKPKPKSKPKPKFTTTAVAAPSDNTTDPQPTPKNVPIALAEPAEPAEPTQPLQMTNQEAQAAVPQIPQLPPVSWPRADAFQLVYGNNQASPFLPAYDFRTRAQPAAMPGAVYQLAGARNFRQNSQAALQRTVPSHGSGAHLPPAAYNPTFDFAMMPQASPMAPPGFGLAMDSIPAPVQLPEECDLNSGDDKGNNIPLLCHLCPKKPKFSDVSHLLTHISSKAHLAARFRLECSQKEEGKELLRRFDEWSSRYGVDKLLTKRQAAKEEKKEAQLKRQRGAAIERKPKRSNIAPETVKTGTSATFDHQIEHNANPLNNGNLWHLHTPRDTSFGDRYHTPSARGDHSAYPLPDSPQASAFINHETLPSNTDPTDTILQPAADDGGIGDSGAAKLKGLILPGMDMFDAATPEKRRKRNQKKDGSVVTGMETDSRAIQQIEYVWDSRMVGITRVRNVYDSPSVDGSPESRDEQVPAVKKRRSRRATSTTTRPQTRATARATKAGKRRRGDSIQQNLKTEDVLGSEDEECDPHSGHDLTVLGGGSGDSNNNTGDVFGEHYSITQGLNGSPLGHLSPFPYRTALHGLAPNRPMSSMFARRDNQPSISFLDKENDRTPFPMQAQQPADMHGYFAQQRHDMQPNGLNPLCVQRHDNFPYMYANQGFDPSKTSNASFQSISNMDFSGISSNSQYPSGPAQNQHNNLSM